jgi:hypothetical protein
MIFLPLFAIPMACTHAASPPAASAAPAGRFENGRPVIVRMAGRASKTLTVVSTGHGPAYSVSDAQGHTLLSQGTLDDLRREHPELYRQVRQGLVSAGEGTGKEDDDDSLDYVLLGAL